MIGAGRYVDNFERRGDEWRIMKRLVIIDWFRQYPDSADCSQGMLGIMIDPGGRDEGRRDRTRMADDRLRPQDMT